MPDSQPCTVCGDVNAEILQCLDHENDIHWKCQRCGEFHVLGSATGPISRFNATQIANLSGWIADLRKQGSTPRIDRDLVKRVLSRRFPTFTERADRLLLEAVEGQDKLGDEFDIMEPRFISATYSQDSEEVLVLLDSLSERNMMKKMTQSICAVLPKGYAAADVLGRRAGPSDKGFVAMSFSEQLDQAYTKGFRDGILNAGYDPVRVDQVEHVNRIDDEIIALIRSASFVVADFTGHRGGVYFEAGFALGMNLPVIWTCHKDDMDDLHFDIRQYNTIDWDTPDDLALRLQRRIEATLGKGPKAVLDD